MIDWNDRKIYQFGHLALRARQAVAGFITGIHKSPYHGFSVEFSEYKPYNKGESTRFIDWKLFARSQKLFLKRFKEETNLRAYFILDGSRSMLFPKDETTALEQQSKFHFATYLAASLMVVLHEQKDAVGLSLIGDKIIFHSSVRSSFSHHRFLLQVLEQHLEKMYEEKPQQTELVACLHEIAERIHRRSLIILLTDFMDVRHNMNELYDALLHIRHNKNEVILFHVIDGQLEGEFQFNNQPHKFIDLESGGLVKIRPAEIRDTYIRNFAQWLKMIEDMAIEFGMDYQLANLRSGLEGVLIPFFMRRLQVRS
ncbi:MAG: DUF58 domain-containing protein [Bacteroidales bacterium]|nr:DUF58 domain-containing protein [Bacteroidales bacterium]